MSQTSKNSQRKKNVGILVDWFNHEYQAKIIAGAIEIANRHDINIYCLEGGCIHSKREYETIRTTLFSLITKEEIDGLVILAATVGFFATAEQIQAFCDQFAPIPIVTISQEVEGYPAVLTDNSPGLSELVTHLVEVHQYRNFAYISGPYNNYDAICRLNILKKLLSRYNLPLDDRLIYEGQFTQQSGAEGVNVLLKQSKDIDVIVAANDEMAIGALYELKSKNIQVPSDIAVIGFDNLDASAFCPPPLTTIEQSLYQQGMRSMELVLDLINKKTTPKRVYIPSKLVIRESCGCLSQLISKSKPKKQLANNQNFETVYALNKERIIHELINQFSSFFAGKKQKDFSKIVDKLINSLYIQLKDTSKEVFLKCCHQTIQAFDPLYEYTDCWQRLFAELRQKFMPLIALYHNPFYAENLIHQAQIMIIEKAVIREKRVYHETLKDNFIISCISEELLVSVNVSELTEILAQRLPQLGVSSCFLSESTRRSPHPSENSPRKFKLLFGYNHQGQLKLGKQAYYYDGLVPDLILEDKQPHTLLIMMLLFSKNYYGTVGFEVNPHNSNIYSSLRRIINSSMSGIFLTKQLQKKEKALLSQQVNIKNLIAIRQAMEGFISTILMTIEIRDPYTAGHQNRVAALASAIATEMGLSPEIIESIRMAGTLHDLGKISIPVEILNKPGSLKTTEFMLINEHPAVAYDILKNIDFPWPLADIILQHHERLDGSGYPNKLMNDQIRLEARILTVADVIEAMASHRPYRPALGIDEALKEISINKGKLYDPDVVDACLRLFKEKGYQLINSSITD